LLRRFNFAGIQKCITFVLELKRLFEMNEKEKEQRIRELLTLREQARELINKFRLVGVQEFEPEIDVLLERLYYINKLIKELEKPE
jgi:hypothetical protein